MKKYLWTLFAIILLAGTSCQEKIDIEKEKAAIIAVIEEETNAFRDRDFDRFAATYVQDKTFIRLNASKDDYDFSGMFTQELSDCIYYLDSKSIKTAGYQRICLVNEKNFSKIVI